MHKPCLALTAALLATQAVCAQQTGQTQPNQQQQQAALDAHLQRWEAELKKIETFQAQCTRIEVDKGFATTETFVGSAKYMKPNMAVLDMQKKDKPEVFEKVVFTGTFVYQFAPAEKKVYVTELPKPKQGQVADDGVLSLICSMKADDIKQRYDVKLDKEDQWYVYILIYPKKPEDKAEFTRARLVLNKDSFLPREIWFESPLGKEVKWDIPKIQANVKLDRNEFGPPQVPKDWRLEENRQPRVVRPNQ